MNKIFVLVLLGCLSVPVVADSVLEEVVVTAQKRSASFDGIPAVTVKKRADYLVQRVKLINDSRSPDLRKKEIVDTIDNLIKAARKIKGIELSYGEGFLLPINLNDESLQLIEDSKRTDTSSVSIFIKIALDQARAPRDQIAELRSFIEKANRVSRTEIEVLDDVGVSLINPEQYRYEILKKVSEENNRVKEVVGGSCEITIAGLQGRVEWERSDVAELTLYIPYMTEVKCK